MTTFYLIRHAERAGDQHLLIARTAGVHLTDRGRAQAERLAQHLACEPIAHVLTSPMERARQTAAPLAREKKVTPELCEAIDEIDAGEWTGKTFSELDRDDERWRRFNHFRSATPIPGGESALEVQRRFVGEILALRQRLGDTTVALVSHADPIKIALAYFLGAPLDFYNRIEIGLASVSVIELDDWHAKITRLNDCAATREP